MKLIIALMALTSFSTFAGELKVMEVATKKIRFANLVTLQFEVDLNGTEHGVSLRADTIYHGGDVVTTDTDIYENVVPELSLNDKLFTVSIDGVETVCGTMGQTRIFKRPTLRLSGKCNLVKRTTGNMTEVYLVTK